MSEVPTADSSWVGILVLAALVLVAWAAPAEAAGPSSSPSGEPPGESGALGLLAESNEAATGVPYRGLRFVSQWSSAGATTFLVRVRHLPSRGTAVRVVGGGADDASVRYQRPSAPRLNAGGGRVLDLLGKNYELAVAGSGTVAGRPSHVVQARRRDGSLAARFWLDRDTGLMLRREVRDRHGRVVQASAFIDLKVGAPRRTRRPPGAEPPTASAGSPPVPSPGAGPGRPAEHAGSPVPAPPAPSSSGPPAMPRPWQRVEPDRLDALRAQGWTLPRRLPSGLARIGARRGVVDGASVLHLSYSDGLSSVSLFVQRGTLAADRLGGSWHEATLGECCVVFRQHTLPRRAVWSGDGQVYTVVANAPPGVVEQVAAALPHGSQPGFWGRMVRGFTDLGSWLNPVG